MADYVYLTLVCYRLSVPQALHSEGLLWFLMLQLIAPVDPPGLVDGGHQHHQAPGPGHVEVQQVHDSQVGPHQVCRMTTVGVQKFCHHLGFLLLPYPGLGGFWGNYGLFN